MDKIKTTVIALIIAILMCGLMYDIALRKNSVTPETSPMITATPVSTSEPAPVETPPSTEAQMYDYLLSRTQNKVVTCAILANGKCETGLCPYRLEADRGKDENGVYTISREYTDWLIKHDNGFDDSWEYFERKNIEPGLAGYGIFGFTDSTRKQRLWDFAKATQRDIDDWQMQLDFCLVELARDYPKLLEEMYETKDVEYATYRFAARYEQTYCDVRRYEAAHELWERYA